MIHSTTNSKRDLNFELNLMPVFDILSVCICFLLMTVAWIQIGSLNASQSSGGQSQAAQNPPSIWANMDDFGNVTLQLKDVVLKAQPNEMVLRQTNGDVAWSEVNARVQAWKRAAPVLTTAVILPSRRSPYEQIIRLMDGFKSVGIKDIGISPL